MVPKAEPIPVSPMPLAYHVQPLWDSLDVKLCSVTSESLPSKSDEELPSMWTLPWCPPSEMVPTEFCELLGATKGCIQGPVTKTAEQPSQTNSPPLFIPRPPQAHPELPHSIISTPITILFPTWVLSPSKPQKWKSLKEVKRWNQEVFKHPGSKGWAFSFLSRSKLFCSYWEHWLLTHEYWGNLVYILGTLFGWMCSFQNQDILVFFSIKIWKYPKNRKSTEGNHIKTF